MKDGINTDNRIALIFWYHVFLYFFFHYLFSWHTLCSLLSPFHFSLPMPCCLPFSPSIPFSFLLLFIQFSFPLVLLLILSYFLCYLYFFRPFIHSFIVSFFLHTFVTPIYLSYFIPYSYLPLFVSSFYSLFLVFSLPLFPSLPFFLIFIVHLSYFPSFLPFILSSFHVSSPPFSVAVFLIQTSLYRRTPIIQESCLRWTALMKPCDSTQSHTSLRVLQMQPEN
jgi:hypothetical protein